MFSLTLQITFFFYISELDIAFQLKDLEKPVDVIDDAYIETWMSVELSVKTKYYKKTNINEIFKFLPNLKNELGYLLVSVHLRNQSN